MFSSIDLGIPVLLSVMSNPMLVHQDAGVPRIRHRTARFVFDVRTAPDGNTDRFVTEIAEDTLLEQHLGDGTGYHAADHTRIKQWLADNPEFHQTEEMNRWGFAEPKYKLLADGYAWSKEGSGPTATAISRDWRPSSMPYDIARCGLGPAFGPEIDNELGVPQSLLSYVAEGEYSETVLESGRVVTLTGSSHRLEWQLDASKGGQPTKVTLYRNDAPIFWSVSELKEFDGRWFPATTSYFKARHRNGDEPYVVVTVLDASFDKPEHRQLPFGADDIGIGLGHSINVTFADGTGPGRPMYWDGVELITKEEFDELIYLYGLPLDPRKVENDARYLRLTKEEFLEQLDKTRELRRKQYAEKHGQEFHALIKLTEEDDWDRYVREFVAKYSLQGSRKDAAYSLLDRCKRVRERYRRQLSPAGSDASVNDAKKNRLSLIEQRIFERQLKRHLVSLLPDDRKP